MVRLVPIASNFESNVFFGLWFALARAVWYFHSPSIHQRKSIQCPPSCQGFPFTKFRDYWAGFFQSLWKQLPIEVHDVFKLQGAQLMSQSFESNQIHLLVAQSCQGFASAAPELIRIVQSCADRIKMDQDGSSYVKFKSKAQLLRATSMGTMESSNPWHIKMGISHLSAAFSCRHPWGYPSSDRTNASQSVREGEASLQRQRSSCHIKCQRKQGEAGRTVRVIEKMETHRNIMQCWVLSGLLGNEWSFVRNRMLSGVFKNIEKKDFNWQYCSKLWRAQGCCGASWWLEEAAWVWACQLWYFLHRS